MATETWVTCTVGDVTFRMRSDRAYAATAFLQGASTAEMAETLGKTKRHAQYLRSRARFTLEQMSRRAAGEALGLPPLKRPEERGVSYEEWRRQTDEWQEAMRGRLEKIDELAPQLALTFTILL